ncbi:MAG: hypothetical protein AAGJ73_05255 [Pseudomonadota bacterium]
MRQRAINKPLAALAGLLIFIAAGFLAAPVGVPMNEAFWANETQLLPEYRGAGGILHIMSFAVRCGGDLMEGQNVQ